VPRSRQCSSRLWSWCLISISLRTLSALVESLQNAVELVVGRLPVDLEPMHLAFQTLEPVIGLSE
jgi:hypothetical protein